MKLLTTEQQEDLQQLINNVPRHLLDHETSNRLDYWAIELKPKRVRRLPKEEQQENV